MYANLKEAFIASVRATLAQGRPSYHQGGCYYRAEGGLKCAIGHLIPDAEYTPDMECGSVDQLVGKFPDLLSFLSKEPEVQRKQLLLLQVLQQAHDAAAIGVVYDRAEGKVPDFNKSFLQELRRELQIVQRPAALEWVDEACRVN